MALSIAHFRLGAWLVEPGVNRLTRGCETVRIEPRAMEVLVYLKDRAGELVCKQELIDHVWRAEVVAQGSLTAIISQLRSALHDDTTQPEYIETIHTKGYRLVAEIDNNPEIHDPLIKKAKGIRPAFVSRDQKPTSLESSLGGDPRTATAAETGLLKTIETAGVQGDHYQELRAAARLASLWKDQGRIIEALELLQPIVDSFSDEIDTVPLLEAKALLWDLIDRPD